MSWCALPEIRVMACSSPDLNFTQATALHGNDLSTFPDFPAEIRAPVGATFGVSAFQIYFGAEDVTTAGDELDVLVAMNPAALITNLHNLVEGGLLIVDGGAFTAKNLTKAKYDRNPSRTVLWTVTVCWILIFPSRC